MQALRALPKDTWKKSSECAWRIHNAEETATSKEAGGQCYVSIEDFARILHKCGREKDQVQASRLHAYMRDNGLDTHASLGNYLVSMLVEVGNMHDAQQVFDKLSYRSSWSWNPLITGYIKQGNPRHALNLYQKMQKDDFVYLGAHTFVALVKACAILKDLQSGLRLHVEVAEIGLLENNIFIGSILIDMYAKCGLLARARQVFDKIFVRDVVSWTALITGYVEYGRGEDALECFGVMQREGVSPNAAAFVSSLKACCIIGAVEKGQEVHAEIERKGGLERDIFVGSTLVDMYSKFGLLSIAENVFDSLPTRDVVLWTALIAGYAEHGRGDYALECFQRMRSEGVSPNAATFVCALKACGSIGAADKGQEIHAEVDREGLLESNLLVGGSLVDMYAKCDMLVKAQYVFDNLRIRDVVSWTALIAGYADHGHSEEAIACFEQMQVAGVRPNAATIVCVLKAYGSIQAIDKCQVILTEIKRQGLLEKNPIVGSTVVDMYVKCGSLDMAQKVFDKLPVRDVVAWTALIAGYAGHGYDAEALNCLEHMQLEGIPPNSATFVCSLKACSDERFPERVPKLHADIERHGLLKRDLVVGNTLINTYAKCGLFEIAWQILNELPVRDVVSWTALIAGYMEHGRGEEALKCYEIMRSEGISPNAATFVCALKACSTIGAIEKGKEIHDEIERHGLLERDFVVGNTLVDVYVRCGVFAKAHEIFERLEVRNVFSWNTLIAGYSEHGDGEEALKSFEQMQLEGIFPNAITLVCTLKACGMIGARGRGQGVHSQLVGTGLLERDVCVGSSLIDMYGKCGAPALAHVAFDKLPVRDVVSWTALMAGYAEYGHLEDALKCFEQMRLEGVPPNAFTLACSLKICGSIGASNKGQEMHTVIEREGLCEDLHICSSLVDMYAKCGSLVKAQKVFNQLPNRDLISWTSLITGYAEHGHKEEALQCFHKMQLESVFPNAVTIVCCLKACYGVGATEWSNKIHAEIERRGLLEKGVVGNTLISMYAKCNSLGAAKQVFDRLPVQDLVSWNALMTGYAEIGEVESIFDIFNKMLQMGIKPDAVTFIVALTACSRAGEFQNSETFFEAMSRSHGVVPTLEHYTCVIDLFGRAGEIDKGLAMIRRLPLCPDLVVWRSLLGACKFGGNVEAGRQAFNCVVCLDTPDVFHIVAGMDSQKAGKKFEV